MSEQDDNLIDLFLGILQDSYGENEEEKLLKEIMLHSTPELCSGEGYYRYENIVKLKIPNSIYQKVLSQRDELQKI